MSGLRALLGWPWQRWATAGVAGVAIAVLVALPTAVIPSPVFGRAIGVTWWSYPVVVLSGLLGGLLVATYVRATQSPTDDLDAPSKLGMAGAVLTFFAVGCPVCNKLVLLALGTSGALGFFAPLQPVLALASIGLLAWALRARLRGEAACALPRDPHASVGSGTPQRR